jgi:hypothetical protein
VLFRSSLMKVIFVLYDEASYQVFKQELARGESEGPSR